MGQWALLRPWALLGPRALLSPYVGVISGMRIPDGRKPGLLSQAATWQRLHIPDKAGLAGFYGGPTLGPRPKWGPSPNIESLNGPGAQIAPRPKMEPGWPRPKYRAFLQEIRVFLREAKFISGTTKSV